LLIKDSTHCITNSQENQLLNPQLLLRMVVPCSHHPPAAAPTSSTACPSSASSRSTSTTESSPASKTARLIEEYKQHAAEWAAEESASYVDVEGFSSSRSMTTYKGGEKLFFCTAPLVVDGTDAAFHRFLDACNTQKQVEQVQKQHPTKKHLIQ
jgi:hypothetical protein